MRDTELLKVSREDFLAILEKEPEFAVDLLRILGLHLQRVSTTSFVPDPTPSTIALIPLDPDVDIGPFSERLASAFPRDPPAMLRRPDLCDDARRDAYGRLLDRCERSHQHVLLIGSDASLEDPWTRFCIRAGDRLLGLTRVASPPPDVMREPDLRGLDLVVVGQPDPQLLSAWVDALDARTTHLVGIAGFDATAALARGLTGASIGLVLSGGGARGFAHIGVLDELVAAGVAIDRVAGTSMGSYIGGLFALGLSPDEIASRCHEEFVRRNPMNDYTIPLIALTRGGKAARMLTRSFGTARIEALPRHFFCLSSELVQSSVVMHRRGSMAWAVAGSMCLPTVFPPLSTPDGLLVDGGVLNNLPVEQMAASGEGPVIASDVSARLPPPPPRITGGPLHRRLVRRARALALGTDMPLPNIRDTLLRAMTLGSIDSVAAAREYADLVISPDMREFGLLSWNALERMREEGRRAARAALATGALRATWSQ
jgi:predicted acylesterase/phospholipase RssA